MALLKKRGPYDRREPNIRPAKTTGADANIVVRGS